MSRPVAAKQIPEAAVISTIINDRQEGGTGTLTAQAEGYVDLIKAHFDAVGDSTLVRVPVISYHEGLFRLFAKTVNGQGGTPTAPGASKFYTFYYAFCHQEIANADAPTVLDPLKNSFVLNLPNTSATDKTGTIFSASDIFPIAGRYLYFWIDRTAFANANSLVKLRLELVRL
jgi:hypothetical protein